MIIKADHVNAFIDAGDAVAGYALEGPLSGLSLAVKDIFDVKGLRTGAGNRARAATAAPASRTADAVQKLLDAGARFSGKTQTDELAFSLMGNNQQYLRPINTAAPDRFVGGSSSGSAAAVNAGLVDIACGSDTAGSIRAPASFCGLIGLRTTHGAISLAGTTPLAPSFDTFGWFARDLATYERVADVILPAAPAFRLRRLLRCADLDQLVNDADQFESFGRMIEEHVGPAGQIGAPVSVAELSSVFRVLQSFEAWNAHGSWVADHAEAMNKDVFSRFHFGSTISINEYQSADAVRKRFSGFLTDVLGDDGILFIPTVPGASPSLRSTAAELDLYRMRSLGMLCWCSLAGLPQLHVPLGTIDQAPWGFSLVGPPGSDRSLLEVAKLFGLV